MGHGRIGIDISGPGRERNVTTEQRPLDTTGFEGLLMVMRRLRAPVNGCPWDLEQTHASLRNTLLEETYETLEALDSGDRARMVEELGDLLLQVVFHAQIGADEGRFTVVDVVEHLREKLVRRHPHIFGESSARTSGEVIGQWERIKAAERSLKGEGARSMLDGVPKAMPALAYAQAVLDRAGRAGPGPWSEAHAPEPLASGLGAGPGQEQAVGDLLFAIAASAGRAGVDAEAALRGANARFARRFARMEGAVRTEGGTLAGCSESDKARLWEQAAPEPQEASDSNPA